MIYYKVFKMIRGHVTIPITLRRELGWHDGTQFGFERIMNAVLVREVKIVPDDAPPKPEQLKLGGQS